MKNDMDLVVHNEEFFEDLPFFLAQEEYLARNFPGRDLFFAWQVDPTVIIGRNQLLDKEVNVAFCRDNNIDIVRRKSGGGAVIADRDNIMFSYITSSTNVSTTFSDYTSSITSALVGLGLDASDNTRNDILVCGRKVSGNSFYHVDGRSIVHGTMLFNFNPDLMAKALSPSNLKLESHGVKSVRSRVAAIKDFLPDMTIEYFRNHVVDRLTAGGNKIILDEADRDAIKEIRQTYLSPEWLNGKNPRATFSNSHRVEGVGEISIFMSLDKGLIKSFELAGDYLETGDASSALASILTGVSYDYESIRNSLSAISIGTLIPGLKNESFIKLLI